MGLCSSLVLGILKGGAEIELLSKLIWWLFKGGCEPNSEVIVKILFWTCSECFIANWCPSLYFKVIICFLYFLSLKNQ